MLALAKRLRHAPGLRNCERLWQLLRPAYHRLLDPLGRGVRVRLGGRQVRLPAAVLGTNPDWGAYEHESFEALAVWLDNQPGRPVLLDVGCSFGIVTSFAVQVCPRVEVIAFDSDLISLRALDATVPARARHRVRRIDGLLGVEHRSAQSLEAAVVSTLRRLPDLPARDAITRSHFLCFGDARADSAPQHQLDALLTGVTFPGPVLLKCDVEGAELLVLRGAKELLLRARPILLLSVHPSALPQHGHTVGDLAAFLQKYGYRWRLLARDHEEHWWCEPTNR